MRSPSSSWARPQQTGAKVMPYAERQMKHCPPHNPLVVDPSRGKFYVAWCLECGLRGPERVGVLEAKRAFDASYHSAQ